MKRLSMLIVAASCMAVAVPTMVTPASAYVRKSVTVKRGVFGHGCRTVRTVRRGPLGRGKVTVRRVCH